MKNESKIIGIALILVVIVGFIAFGVGMAFQRARLARGFYYGRPMMNFQYGVRPQNFGFGPNIGFNGMQMRRGVLNGTITGISGNQVTLKLPDGSTRAVNLSSSTQYSQLSTASQSNLQNGQNVTITGQTSSNGSVSAQTLRINPGQ